MIYDELGGEPVLRKLVRKFYRWMDTLPEAHDIRKMHPPDLSTSEEKLFLFLSGWTGGPQLFLEKYGHPRLRARHLPFSIGKEERDQWMLCMSLALDELEEERDLREPLRSELEKALYQVADHMRNRVEE